MTPTNSATPSFSALLQEVSQQSYPTATLYVVATPIGNIGDITLRAINALAIADAVACEDTRNTGHLLSRYGLSKELMAAHEHNERAVADKIIARLQSGQRVALVSDAGTPAVSDPGARIVDAVRTAGLRVLPLPGPSAAVAALSAGGLLQDRFLFVGFLPARAKQRETALQRIATVEATLVLYEAPHRVAETAGALLQVLGPQRQVVFAREMSKLFEEIHRCRLEEAPAWLAADPNREKGEYVLLVEGAPESGTDDEKEAERILAILLEECSVKQAASLAARITGQKKNALYEQALAMKDRQ